MSNTQTSNRKKSKKKKHLILRVFAGILILVTIIPLIGIISSLFIEVTTYNIETSLSSPIRLVQITDLHNHEFGKENQRLVNKIQSLSPDLICITGDMINDDCEDISVVTTLIKHLSEIAPVYYGYGNHEITWEQNYRRDLYFPITEAGATVLNDTYMDVRMNNDIIRIGGVMNYYRRWGMMVKDKDHIELQENFANLFENTDHYKILLNHIPTTFSDWHGTDDYPVDLVLTGHYHGGMIRIPFLNQGIFAPYMGLFPPHTKGMLQGTKGICIQSAGLGSEHLIPRIYNPSEIVVINLQASQ